METTKENVLDYCSKIKLQNNHVLVCVEGIINTAQLNNLSSTIDAANKNTATEFFKDLAKNPKTIVKISNKITSEYPELEFGDYIKFNDYGDPQAIFVEEDPLELDNVIANYKHDSKDVKFVTSLTSIKYTIRCYYSYEAGSIILIKKL